MFGLYLWKWYVEISDSLNRIDDGKAVHIPPTEFVAWAKMTRNVVYPNEYAIMLAMDRAYCDEMNKELHDLFLRREAEREKQNNKPVRRSGK